MVKYHMSVSVVFFLAVVCFMGLGTQPGWAEEATDRGFDAKFNALVQGIDEDARKRQQRLLDAAWREYEAIGKTSEEERKKAFAAVEPLIEELYGDLPLDSSGPLNLRIQVSQLNLQGIEIGTYQSGLDPLRFRMYVPLSQPKGKIKKVALYHARLEDLLTIKRLLDEHIFQSLTVPVATYGPEIIAGKTKNTYHLCEDFCSIRGFHFR